MILYGSYQVTSERFLGWGFYLATTVGVNTMLTALFLILESRRLLPKASEENLILDTAPELRERHPSTASLTDLQSSEVRMRSYSAACYTPSTPLVDNADIRFSFEAITETCASQAEA